MKKQSSNFGEGLDWNVFVGPKLYEKIETAFETEWEKVDRINAQRRKYHQRRYRLHRMARRYGIKVNAEIRELDIAPYRTPQDFPVPGRYYLNQLLKLGYNIQLKLL